LNGRDARICERFEFIGGQKFHIYIFQILPEIAKTWQYLPDGWRYQRWGEATKPSN